MHESLLLVNQPILLESRCCVGITFSEEVHAADWLLTAVGSRCYTERCHCALQRKMATMMNVQQWDTLLLEASQWRDSAALMDPYWLKGAWYGQGPCSVAFRNHMLTCFLMVAINFIAFGKEWITERYVWDLCVPGRVVEVYCRSVVAREQGALASWTSGIRKLGNFRKFRNTSRSFFSCFCLRLGTCRSYPRISFAHW